jgi:quercetin dioxygenase-like cupin family protein
MPVVRSILCLVALILCLSPLAATAAPPAAGQEVVWPADQVPFKEVVPGVSKAVLWGDPDKGPYGAITRFVKGLRNSLHTHSSDIRIVVVSGNFVYDSGSGEKSLGPGSVLFQPAGAKHVSGAGKDADCVFVESSDGPFDLKPVQ